MKKTIGTILAVLCLAAALLLGSGTAFAQTAGQWTPREHPQDTIGCVNGAQSDEIIAQADRDLGGCKFTYRGKGKLTGWEVPLLEEGKDYKILSQSGRSITIEALDGRGLSALYQCQGAAAVCCCLYGCGNHFRRGCRTACNEKRNGSAGTDAHGETDGKSTANGSRQHKSSHGSGGRQERKHRQGKPAGIAFGCAGCLCFGCGCPCTLAKKAAPIRE